LALGGRGVSAQTSESFPLERSTRQELAELQESWIEWLAELNRGELETAASTIVGLVERSESLGMSGLPDLADAAAIQAVAFSADTDFEKAEAALEAAELLQVGEPEVALAAMTVARRQGRWIAAGSWLGRGVVRLFRAPLSRRVVLANLFQWLLVILTLAAFSFVGLEMATRGGLLVRDLSGLIGHSLPPLAASALTALLLLWPVVLPAGLLWLALYWSVLLWGYGTRVVRVVMIALWIFVGGLPLLVSEHVRRVDFGLSTPVRAMENLMAGRMPGSLFSDFGVLVDLLPESVAVKHLQADLHLQLKQWEMARSLYLEVLDAESGRNEALADLGAVYFYQGDLDKAIQYLEQAAAVAEAPAQVYFNLSRVLSEQYRFDESEAMLRRARTLDSRTVGRWIASIEADRVVGVAGGKSRRSEILGEVESVWRSDVTDLAGVWRRTLSLPLAIVLAGPAMAMFLLSRRSRRRFPREAEAWFDGPVERIRNAILPGLPEAENKKVGRTWLALCVALALFSLPFSTGYGFSVPLAYSPGLSPWWLVASVGLFSLALMRFLMAGQRRSKGV
jgi:tetratricopeptide (TPR) repeat protein